MSAGEGAGEACEPHVADGATWIVEENSVAAVAATVASSPNAVRNADLITVTIGVNQIVHIAFANGCAASACARAEREFERQYTSLLNRLTELRPASKAAYRLLTEYNLPASSTVRRLLRLPPPDPTGHGLAGHSRTLAQPRALTSIEAVIAGVGLAPGRVFAS